MSQPTEKSPKFSYKDKEGKTKLLFTQVENCIALDPDRSLAARAIYQILASFADKKSYCWPGIDTIAKIAGISPRMVMRYLTELEDNLAIITERRGKKQTNIYHLLPRLYPAAFWDAEKSDVTDVSSHSDDMTDMTHHTGELPAISDAEMQSDVTDMTCGDMTDMSPNVYPLEIDSSEEEYNVNVTETTSNFQNDDVVQETTLPQDILTEVEKIGAILKDRFPANTVAEVTKCYSNLLDKYPKMQNEQFITLMCKARDAAKKDHIVKKGRYFLSTLTGMCAEWEPLPPQAAREAQEIDPLGNAEQNQRSIERFLARSRG